MRILVALIAVFMVSGAVAQEDRDRPDMDLDGNDLVLNRIRRDSDLIRGVLGYLNEVYEAALPALQGKTSPDNVFANEFGRMECEDVRELLADTRNGFVDEPIVYRS